MTDGMGMPIGRRQLLAGAAAAAGIGVAGGGAAAAEAVPEGDRTVVSLDAGWRFHLGHGADPAADFGFGASHDTFAKSGDAGTPVAAADYDDAGWAAVSVPHDWAVALPFVRFGPAGSAEDKAGAYQGFKPVGRRFPATSVGWYRRRIAIPADGTGRRWSLEFDGVARDCMVILNGFFVGGGESGYAPFRIDVSDFVRPGEDNVLVVRCDASLGEAWSYEGAGLYRHVRLVATAPVHVRQWGAAVRCEVAGGIAVVRIATEVDNDGPAATVRLRSRIVAPDGRTVATTLSDPVAIAGWRGATIDQAVRVAGPALWSIDTPALYRLESEVEVDGRVVDRDATRFGIRTIEFDPDHGFRLNGRAVKIKGTCNHQDHAGVGFAVPDSLHRWRIEQLKAMGSNAYRSTHNPPAAAVLDACDELGMLAIDETRQMSSNAEGMGQLERMVRRDRNHPRVILWSIGNEEIHRGTATGAAIARTMKRRVRQLDPTRSITEAFRYFRRRLRLHRRPFISAKKYRTIKSLSV